MKQRKLISFILSIIMIISLSLLFSSCQSSDYSKAKNLMDSEKYDEALEILNGLGNYENTYELIKECNYNIAIDLISKKQYEEALTYLTHLGDYKEATKMINECKNEVLKKKINSSSVGDVLEFGTLTSNNEKIKWLVLSANGDKRLVVSQNSLFEKHYHDPTTEDSTWETCNLRKDLNGTFYNSTFSNEEKTFIIKTLVPAEENPQYPKGYFMGNKYTGSSAGKSTNDYVFILSVSEAERYFASDYERQCSIIGESSTSSWWLRNGGNTQISATNVERDGSILLMGLTKSSDNVAVRPAMWLEAK